MKKTFLIFLILIVNFTVLKSQTEEKNSGFYDFKLSNVSTLKGGYTTYTQNYQTKIPFSLGLSCSYKFSKRIFGELGLSYKSEKGELDIPDIYIAQIGFYGGFYHKYNVKYFDIPLQANINIIKYKWFNLFTSLGLKSTILHYNDYWSFYYEPNIEDNKGTELHISYYLGLIEQFNLSKRIGIFASQNFGQYFIGNNNKDNGTGIYTKDTKTIDFKVGLSYKLTKN